MDVSLIIVSYNVEEYIISCIQSIYKHSNSNLKFEIIVVDNNSKDNTVKKLKDTFENIHLIENDYNAGFSPAVNQGATKCSGKYLFILNPDTLFIEDSIFKIYNYADKLQNFGALGPKLISANGERQQSCWRNPSLFNTILSITHLDFFNKKKNYKNINLTKISHVDTISGGALFVPLYIFKKLKGFNEDLFWMEDIDFCIRLKSLNMDIFYFAKTKIIHFVGRSAATNYKIAISNQMNSKIKFFYSHHSKLSGFIIKILVLSVSLIKVFILFFLFPFSKLYRKKFFAYIYTIRSITT